MSAVSRPSLIAAELYPLIPRATHCRAYWNPPVNTLYHGSAARMMIVPSTETLMILVPSREKAAPETLSG